MAGVDTMTALSQHLADYLAVRRALGYRLERQEKLLGQFLDFLEARGFEGITVESALGWATLPAGRPQWHAKRLRAVRMFARYLRSIELPIEVPPSDLLPEPRERAVPYIYTDAEIAALIDAAGTLATTHRVATFRTLIGLLAVTGMRSGEAIALDRSDFDPSTGVLAIRAGKFDKSRELPLHPSTVAAVSEYLRRPDRPAPPAGADEALLIRDAGGRLSPNTVNHTFHKLTGLARLAPRSAACRPRLHDLRHTFAVRTLLDAYRSGEPAGPVVVSLSTFLGHYAGDPVKRRERRCVRDG
ncbi:MAG: tyrosine-type recombinase/integrase [Solirubrobacteraceae bacterium]